MKKNKKAYLILMTVLAIGCKNKIDMSGPVAFANSYCDCMTKNGSPNNYLNARNICDAKLMKEYRLYRLYRKDIKYNLPNPQLKGKLLDSVFRFMNKADSCTKDKCCDVVLNCSGVTK